MNNLIGIKLPKQKSINFPKGIFYKPESKISLKEDLVYKSNKASKIAKSFKININQTAYTKIFNKFKKTPQILENIHVKDKSIIKNSEVKESIKKAEKLMKGYGRILVRESGTESKIRVMGESENKELLDKCINIILRKIK